MEPILLALNINEMEEIFMTERERDEIIRDPKIKAPAQFLRPLGVSSGSELDRSARAVATGSPCLRGFI